MKIPPRLTPAIEHLRARWRLALGAALLAGGAHMTTPAPPEKTVEGVAAMLGREAGGSVAPDQFIWEPRGGFLHDALIGRRVLFLAALPGPSSSPAGVLCAPASWRGRRRGTTCS